MIKATKFTKTGIELNISELHDILSDTFDLDTTGLKGVDCRFDTITITHESDFTEAENAELTAITAELQTIVRQLYKLDARFHDTFDCQ